MKYALLQYPICPGCKLVLPVGNTAMVSDPDEYIYCCRTESCNMKGVSIRVETLYAEVVEINGVKII